MPRYWMITNRAFSGGTPTGELGPVTYWLGDQGIIDRISSWTAVTAEAFRAELVQAADSFPSFSQGDNAAQKHVCFLVHGYNNGFEDAANLYASVSDRLFSGPDGLGICVSFDWPSLGSILGYEPDRDHARTCAPALADVFDSVHQWLLTKQRQTASDPTRACKAKVSVLAHSMGNYVLQKALSAVWKRNNQPLSVSLINQLVMIAADVDNDLFDAISEDSTDGQAVANLSYRVTGLYSGRDDVLGASAGLKHFGTRRLGRSGLAHRPPMESDGSVCDNIWDVDCSPFFPESVSGLRIHGAYFVTDAAMQLVREILKGTDRGVLDKKGLTKGSAWPPGG